MDYAFTPGQSSILHSLMDGDDPICRVPDAELVFFERDLCVLEYLGLVQRSDRRPRLTPLGSEFMAAFVHSADVTDASINLRRLHLQVS